MTHADLALACAWSKSHEGLDDKVEPTVSILIVCR